MNLKALGWATLFSAILWVVFLAPFFIFGIFWGSIFWLGAGAFYMTVCFVLDEVVDKWHN